MVDMRYSRPEGVYANLSLAPCVVASRVCLGTLLCCLLLRAQPADSLTVEQQIYAALSATFAPSPNTSLILFDPGITIDGWIDPHADQLQARLAQIANEGLKSVPLRNPTAATVPVVYDQILRRESWGELVLDKTQQQQFADANKILYKDPAQKTPTSGYALYLQLKDRYTKVQSAWDSTPEDKRTETMRAELDAAARDLELRGNAPLYESNLETIESILATQPVRQRDRWIAQLEGSSVLSPNGSRSFPVSFVPAIGFDYARRWTTIKTDSAPVPSAIAALPWPQNYGGPWRYCAGATFSDSDVRSATGATPTVSMEATALAISRPWMDEALFSYRGWKMSGAGGPISSGGLPFQARGSLPIIVTHIILARNVAIDGQLPPSELAKLTSQSQAGKCSAFGPFVVSGNTEIGTGIVFAVPFGGGFYSPNTEVIGVLVTSVPKSPDPDLTHYRWP